MCQCFSYFKSFLGVNVHGACRHVPVHDCYLIAHILRSSHEKIRTTPSVMRGSLKSEGGGSDKNIRLILRVSGPEFSLSDNALYDGVFCEPIILL